MTAAVTNNRYYEESARHLRAQVAFSFGAIGVSLLGPDVNPLATGIAAQTLSKAVHIAIRYFSNLPPASLRAAISGTIFFAVYIGASKFDLRIQAIFYLALLLLDVKEVGLKNVWKVLNTPPVPQRVPDRSDYAMAASNLRGQIGGSLFTWMVTALKIANINPLAIGIVVNCFELLPKAIEKLPPLIQMFTVCSAFGAAYSVMSSLDHRIQAATYIALIGINLFEIHPRNAWKELTNWRTA
jgi:hypothetical protein